MKIHTIVEGIYGVTLMGFFILLNPVLRRWHLKWGCIQEEATMVLPGDELVPEIKVDATHAITIHTPAATIWPWIVQIGADKGGFYSYDFLENLVGCQLKSVDRIIPEWQNLNKADSVSLHPKAPRIPVSICLPNQSLVLGQVWGFHLKPVDATTTRLLVRARGGYDPRIKNSVINFLLWHVLYEPIHFIMEQKMMKSIKRLAENSPAIKELGTTKHQADEDSS
jgi:hypothetical protein